jgi:DNA-binding CsgD family transcriptional regulator/tetratricopeptide (TPR) repeat protein
MRLMSDATLDQAREAFSRQAWLEAWTGYRALAEDAPLTLDDIERQAIAAHLVGEEAASREALAKGYREALAREDVTRAVRFAFWLGHGMFFTGEMGQANGWFGRARGLLSERGVDCVEWGYLLIPTGVERLMAGAPADARDAFVEAQTIGRRFADPNLVAMAGHGRGRALIALGAVADGIAVLDEVMIAVTTGEVSAMVIGDIYCGVLEACRDVFDLRRAREWTAALTRWCDGHPDMVPYRGPCLVHRVDLMRLHGDWEDAIDEARQACDWLSQPASPEGPGDAFYVLGELYRLRGDLSAAEEAYRRAGELGRPLEPGIALLWLANGQVAAAASAIQRAIDESEFSGPHFAELLAAQVEIRLAGNDVAAARTASTELGKLAAKLDAPQLTALAERAEGNVLIAEGQPGAALAPLRRSWGLWRQLDAPYEAAQVRVLIASACRALGDEQSAAMEVDAARSVFERLGALPDLARLEIGPAGNPTSGLTAREAEVLCLIAEGQTNKEIAATLVISEHTVARHVQNMLHKLGFSSRASLAAYAVEHGLVRHGPGQN